MRTKLACVAVTVVAVAMAGGISVARAQSNGPAPESAVLKDYAGDWDAVVRSLGAETKGTLAARMAVGGQWLVEDFKGEFAGAPFEGHSTTGYDTTKKKVINIWIDSMSSSPVVSEGTYDKATKTWTFIGNMHGPDGSSMKMVQTIVTKDADTRVQTVKGVGPDGKDLEMLSVTYRRRKK